MATRESRLTVRGPMNFDRSKNLAATVAYRGLSEIDRDRQHYDVKFDALPGIVFAGSASEVDSRAPISVHIRPADLRAMSEDYRQAVTEVLLTERLLVRRRGKLSVR